MGEVCLVIVGILIALQVNNWNEERIEQNQIGEYAQALVSDLERDIAMIEPINGMMLRTLDALEAMGTYTRGKNLDQIDNLDLFYMTSLIGYRPYQWHRAALEQLKSSGSLRNIRNADLVMKITAYDSLSHHLDDDFAQDRELLFEAKKQADEVVDYNYPDNEQAQALVREPFSFPNPRFNTLYEETELPLLTDDMHKVKAMVNKYQELGNIKAHTDRELPELLAQAKELIELLKTQYPPKK